MKLLILIIILQYILLYNFKYNYESNSYNGLYISYTTFEIPTIIDTMYYPILISWSQLDPDTLCKLYDRNNNNTEIMEIMSNNTWCNPYYGNYFYKTCNLTGSNVIKLYLNCVSNVNLYNISLTFINNSGILYMDTF